MSYFSPLFAIAGKSKSDRWAQLKGKCKIYERIWCKRRNKYIFLHRPKGYVGDTHYLFSERWGRQRRQLVILPQPHIAESTQRFGSCPAGVVAKRSARMVDAQSSHKNLKVDGKTVRLPANWSCQFGTTLSLALLLGMAWFPRSIHRRQVETRWSLVEWLPIVASSHFSRRNRNTD